MKIENAKSVIFINMSEEDLLAIVVRELVFSKLLNHNAYYHLQLVSTYISDLVRWMLPPLRAKYQYAQQIHKKDATITETYRQLPCGVINGPRRLEKANGTVVNEFFFNNEQIYYHEKKSVGPNVVTIRGSKTIQSWIFERQADLKYQKLDFYSITLSAEDYQIIADTDDPTFTLICNLGSMRILEKPTAHCYKLVISSTNCYIVMEYKRSYFYEIYKSEEFLQIIKTHNEDIKKNLMEKYGWKLPEV